MHTVLPSEFKRGMVLMIEGSPQVVGEFQLDIMVPLFIGPGDTVRVDTATRKYLGEETTGRK
jgi:hypothetical protein